MPDVAIFLDLTFPGRRNFGWDVDDIGALRRVVGPVVEGTYALRIRVLTVRFRKTQNEIRRRTIANREGWRDPNLDLPIGRSLIDEIVVLRDLGLALTFEVGNRSIHGALVFANVHVATIAAEAMIVEVDEVVLTDRLQSRCALTERRQGSG